MLDTAKKKAKRRQRSSGLLEGELTTRCTLKSPLNCVFLTIRGGRVPKDFLGCVFGSMIYLHKNERSSFLPLLVWLVQRKENCSLVRYIYVTYYGVLIAPYEVLRIFSET
jgi:hypothetical protein